VRLKLIGTRSNRSAIGAIINARAGNQTITREVMPTRSYLSQSELPVTIGLGELTKLDSLEISWPGGRKQTLGEVQIDRLNTIEEPR